MVFAATEADRPSRAPRPLCPATTSLLYISALWLALFTPPGNGLPTLRFEMMEEEPRGCLVGVIGENLSDLLHPVVSGSGDRLSFRALQDGQSGLFTVDPNNGTILVAQRVDREELCPNSETSVIDQPSSVSVAATCQLSFTVNLLRLTGLGSEIVAIIRVLITVQDVDDHRCSFYPTGRQTLRISENRIYNSENAFPLHQPWDLDTGFQHGIDKSTIHLFRTEGNGRLTQLSQLNSPFALTVNETGLAVRPFALYLSVVKALDYEQKQEYNLMVEVQGFDRSSSNTTCQLLLQVLVLDTNDHAPKFSQSSAVIKIPETTSPSTPIYTLSAFDADASEEHGRLVYALDPFSSAHIKSTFRVDKTNGSVFLNKPLDYRSRQTYELAFIVYNPSSGGTVAVPSLPLPERHLQRNLSTGQQLSLHLVDRATLRVYVLDVNDHAPVISVYNPDGGVRISLTEHQAPLDIAIVSVQDGDGGVNGRLVCDLDAGSRVYFKLTLISGVDDQHPLTASMATPVQDNRDGDYVYKLSAVASVDRETHSVITVKIYCHDFGVPQMDSELTVNVLVDDINDNRPTFNSSTWEFKVMEDSDPIRKEAGYFIGHLTAFDTDDNNNALITYQLISSANEPVEQFKVDPRSGVLRSRGNLDREVRGEYHLILLASDRGTPSQTGTCTVKIVILDYNDNAPVFEKPVYRFFMQENNVVGTAVGSIKATDNDIGSNAEVEFKIATAYFMDAYSKDGQFLVSSKFGKRVADNPFKLVTNADETLGSYTVTIHTTKIIDREFLQTRNRVMHSGKEMLEGFTLWIVGEDNGIPKQRGHAIVHIHVKDTNDEAPRFEQPDRNFTTINVSYRQHPGLIFFQVVARDADAGLNGTVRYHIRESSVDNTHPTASYRKSHHDAVMTEVGAGNQKLFNIDQVTGGLFLRQALDPQLIGTVYRLAIVAKDMGSPWQLSNEVFLLVLIDQSEVSNRTILNTMTNDQAMAPKLEPVQGGTSETRYLVEEEEGRSMLNFYIIFGIVLTSLITSLSLMCGIWIVLRRRGLFHKLTPTPSRHENTSSVLLDARVVKGTGSQHELSLLPGHLDHNEATGGTLSQSAEGRQTGLARQRSATEHLQLMTFHPLTGHPNEPASLDAMRSLSGQFQPFSIVYSTTTGTQLCVLHTAEEATNSLTSAEGDSGKGDSLDIANTVVIPLSSEPVWFPSELTPAAQATVPNSSPANSTSLPVIRLVTSPASYAETLKPS